jgi:hypothetical protein
MHAPAAREPNDRRTAIGIVTGFALLIVAVIASIGRPFSISSFRLADLGEKADYYLRDQPKPSQSSTRGNLSEFILGCCLHDARFIAALLRQHSPGDPRQLVGESRSQTVRM